MASEVIRKTLRKKRKKGKNRDWVNEQTVPTLSSLCDTATSALLEDLQQQDFSDIGNIVFEGGGSKCLAYVGVAMVLDELGVLPTIRRFAGTSGGAIFAMLLSLGYTPSEIQVIMGKNLKELIYDSTGMVAALPNVVRKFGWHRAAKATDFLRLVIKEKTGSTDTTFWEVYKKFGRELCVVACNLTTMSIEYFHPKTTPDVSIAIAVRASMSIPGLMQPVTLHRKAMKHYLVDGGIVCNFPLHCFDGWFLSMKADDSFFHNLGVNMKPFGKYNSRTVGFVVYSVDEPELMKSHLEARFQKQRIPRPQTRLAKARAEKCDEILATNEGKTKLLDAGQRFLGHLRAADLNRDGSISLKEFQDTLKVRKLSDEDIETLFGKGFDIKNVFDELDMDSSGKITFEEFVCHMQSKGVPFRAMMEGSNMAIINNLGDYASVIFETIANQTRKVFFKHEDLQRTAGISVDYIQTCDFDLETGDKEFLIKQGIVGCVQFLKHKYGLSAKNEHLDSETVDVSEAPVAEVDSDQSFASPKIRNSNLCGNSNEQLSNSVDVSKGPACQTDEEVETDLKKMPENNIPGKIASLPKSENKSNCSPRTLANRLRRKQFFSDMSDTPATNRKSDTSRNEWDKYSAERLNEASIDPIVSDNTNNIVSGTSLHSDDAATNSSETGQSQPAMKPAQCTYSF